MLKFAALSLYLLAAVQIISASTYEDTDFEEFLKSVSGEHEVDTTHSENHRPIQLPVYERFPIEVPNPAPFSVPHYVRVGIPQPYPKYNHVRHKIEVPVYRAIPEYIEKPVPYTVEKPFPVEVEKPFPVEAAKQLDIPVPKPYPVRVVYYNHVSEDHSTPKATRPTKPSKPTRPAARPQNEYDFSSIFSNFKLPNLMDMFMPRKKAPKVKKFNTYSFEELYKHLLNEVPPSPPPYRKKYSSTKYGGEFSPSEHHEYQENQPR